MTDGKLTKAEKRAARKVKQYGARVLKRRETNKAKRHEAQAIRKAMLTAMTLEERREFIHAERAEKERSATELLERLQLMKHSGKLHLCVALAFMDHMVETEQMSLAKQIQWFWNSIVRRSSWSVKLDLADFNPTIEQQCRKFGFINWQVNVFTQSCLDLYSDKHIIILSPDAPDALTEAELAAENTVFIIGGIVDKTVKKNLSISYATDHGLQTRRLPIRERGRSINPVLNINTVADILCEVRFGPLTFNEALDKCVPERKQATVDRLSRKERRVGRGVLSSHSGSESESSDEKEPSNPLLR